MPPTKPHVRGGPDAVRPGKRVTTPGELATRMAALAQDLREDISRASPTGTPTEPAYPLNAHHFADVFAQVLICGLFTVRCSDPAWDLQRSAATAASAATDPFLRRLFDAVARVSLDRQPYAGVLAGLEEMLADTDLAAVIRRLAQHGAGPDPMSRYYEAFLAAYDSRLRKTRGVYYTPEPIVSFMVRAVDGVLKRRFQIPAGLADQAVPPRVLIVDPACGTGIFLSAALALAREAFGKKGGVRTRSRYVHGVLLPRVHGFELLPASAALAHLYLSRKLARHDLAAHSCRPAVTTAGQLDLHVTNSLEELVQGIEQVLNDFRLNQDVAATRLEGESHSPILVILGNPPYRGISANHGKALARLLEDYRLVNGSPLGEKKVWLRNDYVQFLRLGQWAVERAGRGVLALVTDHSYLDSATFRGMRQNLAATFDDIYVLNLHGNAKRRERTPDGRRDENVFGIRQGVAIVLFIKQGKKPTRGHVYYDELWGSRQSKWARLAATSLQTISWKRITPVAPGFELVPVSRTVRAEYDSGWPVKEIFRVSSTGIQTSRDCLVVAFDEPTLKNRLRTFLARDKTDQEVRREFFGDKSVGHYPPGDTREWRLGEARHALRRQRSWRGAITSYVYRPFDQRSLLYLDSMVDWPRREVMHHLQHPNYALRIGRAGLVADGTWDLVFCVGQMCDHNLFYRGSSLNFPLYLYPGGKRPPGLCATEGTLYPNLSPAFLDRITGTLGYRGPLDVFHYVYAMLHASSYRRRYGEFLKFDFPRLPVATNPDLFRALCIQGENLVRAHTLRSERPVAATFPVPGDSIVRRVRYVGPTSAKSAGRVAINDTQYFEPVAPEVWGFRVGGYRICHKWLKDRKGRRLSRSEQARFAQIIDTLSESVYLVQKIDAIIEEHGGWPIRSLER